MSELDELRPTTRFSDRVPDYIRSRPRYPDALVDLVEKSVGLGSDMAIADVGAGTGLSAEPFLRRGHAVTCVEPNPEMRAAAERMLGGHPRFRSVAGTGESTGLDGASVDVILVAQAFHWLDARAARAEFRRVLRRPGWVIVAWNTRHVHGSAFLEEYEALLRQFGTDYEAVRHRSDPATGVGAPDRGLDLLFEAPYERTVLPNWQELDRAGLESRLRSASYTPPPGDPAHGPMLAALAAIFRRHARAGVVRIPYDLEVHIGRVT